MGSAMGATVGALGAAGAATAGLAGGALLLAGPAAWDRAASAAFFFLLNSSSCKGETRAWDHDTRLRLSQKAYL